MGKKRCVRCPFIRAFAGLNLEIGCTGQAIMHTRWVAEWCEIRGKGPVQRVLDQDGMRTFFSIPTFLIPSLQFGFSKKPN